MLYDDETDYDNTTFGSDFPEPTLRKMADRADTLSSSDRNKIVEFLDRESRQLPLDELGPYYVEDSLRRAGVHVTADQIAGVLLSWAPSR